MSEQKIDEKVLIALIKEIQNGNNRELNEALQNLLGDAIKRMPEKVTAWDYVKAQFSGKSALEVALLGLKMPVSEGHKLSGWVFILFTLFVFAPILFFIEPAAVIFAIIPLFLGFLFILIGKLSSTKEEKKGEKDNLAEVIKELRELKQGVQNLKLDFDVKRRT